MMIVDAQVHVWPADRPDRRLGRGVGDRKPYGYEELVRDMTRAGVDRAILVPPSFDADRNDYALEAVRSYPDRFAIMGRVALKQPGNDVLKGWRPLGLDKDGELIDATQPPASNVRFVDGADAFADILRQISNPLELVCKSQNTDDLPQVVGDRLASCDGLDGPFLDRTLHHVHRRVDGDDPAGTIAIVGI